MRYTLAGLRRAIKKTVVTRLALFMPLLIAGVG